MSNPSHIEVGTIVLNFGSSSYFPSSGSPTYAPTYGIITQRVKLTRKTQWVMYEVLFTSNELIGWPKKTTDFFWLERDGQNMKYTQASQSHEAYINILY